RIGSWSQCMRENERGLSMNLVAADVSPLILNWKNLSRLTSAATSLTSSCSQCMRESERRLSMNRDSQTRMTNDQIRRNDQIRMTKPATAQLRASGHSGFGFLSSLVIGHSSFNGYTPRLMMSEF